MTERPYDVAAHEAAHVVVGVALGLRLRHATAAPSLSDKTLGYAWFRNPGHNAAHAIMYAAGCAWERSVGGVWFETIDAKLVRESLPGRGNLQACVRAADAMLRGLRPLHVRVTHALRQRDLGNAEIEAIARGEKLGWLQVSRRSGSRLRV